MKNQDKRIKVRCEGETPGKSVGPRLRIRRWISGLRFKGLFKLLEIAVCFALCMKNTLLEMRRTSTFLCDISFVKKSRKVQYILRALTERP